MTAQLWCFGESGNAYKAALTMELAGYDWRPVHVDFFNGEARSAAFRALNEMGEVPAFREGDLTLMKHRLVSTATLAAIAEGLKLGDYVRFGRGEEKTGGRKKAALLANTLEAVIGAVFFDSGYASARFFIKRVFDAQFRSATPKSSLDFKSMLQETLQARR